MRRGYWFTLILFVLAILGVYKLSQGMTVFVDYQLYLLILVTFCVVGVVTSISRGSLLGHVFAAFLYIGGLINTLLIYIFGTPDTTTLLLTLLVLLAGLVYAIRNLKYDDEDFDVEMMPEDMNESAPYDEPVVSKKKTTTKKTAKKRPGRPKGSTRKKRGPGRPRKN